MVRSRLTTLPEDVRVAFAALALGEPLDRWTLAVVDNRLPQP
jgi:hypothetical protein